MSNLGYYNPLVSVIIPAYNAEKTITHTLNSVLNQTYKNLEIIVVDDGSGDRTTAIVKEIALQEPRIILLEQANSGVAIARNLGIEKSTGEFIAPIDADDIWFAEKIEKQLKCFFYSSSSVGLVYTWSVYINEVGEICGEYQTLIQQKIHSISGYVLPALAYINFLNNASIPLIRRSCFECVGGYDPQLKQQNAQGCEDFDLYLRIAEYYEFRVVPEFLMGYRQLTNSMSLNCSAMAKSYDLVIKKLQLRRCEIPLEIYRWSKSYFYNYLIGKSFSQGKHLETLYLVCRTLTIDIAIALRPGIYKIFLICLSNILVYPIASFIWQDHQSWLIFKQKFNKKKKIFNSLSELQKTIEKQSYSYQKPYDRLLWSRWNQTIQQCKVSSILKQSKKLDNLFELKN